MPGCGIAPPAVPALPSPKAEEAAKPAKVAAAAAAAAAAPAASSRDLEVRAAAAASSSLPAAVRGALELAEARRRLLEAEGRRHLVSELESRVQHLHRVFVEAELRMATRAETLGRLGSGVAQAELHLTAHGQRLKKTARRYKKARPPALLASALALSSCVPWAACRMKRGGGPEPPESPFRRGLQGTAVLSPPKRSETEPLSDAEQRKSRGAAS
ncbi:TMF-regulated nuclear protein 1 [Notechis scutatus]|uniref:TMF-regulated nuclear protein 1 n=1 Tax=Notechis scutatus TaxID=8663 RepID=A0A6J1UW50_9SAUR|nr:TMF-regulated nuclear protein 1 [Notechis scutatus]